jgi:hypothetical protein
MDPCDLLSAHSNDQNDDKGNVDSYFFGAANTTCVGTRFYRTVRL